MTTLTLPWPPSLNALFADGKHRRMKSRRYEHWLAEAAFALSEQHVAPVKGSVSVSLKLSPPTKAERDLDNYAKAVMDFLVSSGIIEGDSRRFVKTLGLFWADEAPAKPGAIDISVAPL